MSDIRTNADAARLGATAVESYREQIASLRGRRVEVCGSIREISDQLLELYDGVVLMTFPAVQRLSGAMVAEVAVRFGALRLFPSFDQLDRARNAAIDARDSAEQDSRFSMMAARMEGAQLSKSGFEEHIQLLEREFEQLRGNDDFWTRREEQTALANPAEVGVFQAILNFVWAWSFGIVLDPIAAKRKAQAETERERRLRDTFIVTFTDTLDERYQAIPGEITVLRQKMAETNSALASLRELRQKHETAVREIDRLDREIPETVRKTLRQHLIGLTPAVWATMHAKVSSEAHITITTIVALKEKVRLLEAMSNYLAGQINDRERRMNQINSAIPNWRRNPHRTTRSDLTGALVTAPAQMARATAARVQGVGTMSSAVVGFNHYGVYNTHLMTNPYMDFLIWDMMVNCHHGHFPGEVFQCAVLPGLGHYHETCPDHAQIVADALPADLMAPSAEVPGLEAGLGADEFNLAPEAAADTTYVDPATFEGPNSDLPPADDRIDSGSSGGGYDGGSRDWNGGGGGDWGRNDSPSHDSGFGGSHHGSGGGYSSPEPSSSYGGGHSSHDPSPSYDGGGGGGYDGGGGSDGGGGGGGD